MEIKRQMVLPVFYRLDPSHVQNLTGSYGDALCKHERDCSSQEVESWRRALKEIANLKGWDSNVIKVLAFVLNLFIMHCRDETKLIQEIVSDIQKKLNHELSLSFDSKRLVGMASRVEDIESLLSFGSTGVLIVGIWGMGGIGKKILGEVLEKKDMTIRTKVLPPAIKRMLQRKKVLIVLDDVNDPQDLKYLVGEDGLFGQGSRIMVTSRDRQVLLNACDEDKIYKVKILDEDDALRLFSLHAFKQDRSSHRRIYNERSVEYWESKVAQLRTNETFEGMYNLRLLKIYYPSFLENPSKEQIMNGKRVGIHLPRGLHFLSSELRFLYWYNYPLKSLPSKFFPEKPFQLEMPCSQLEQLWNEGKNMDRVMKYQLEETYTASVSCC
ncbi:hypothetical protein NC652_012791 [Populus alba x Populus x berolinensis]|nr:hypothetical protein NC652_012791 [Populus alba x Populus x berolinensis]